MFSHAKMIHFRMNSFQNLIAWSRNKSDGIPRKNKTVNATFLADLASHAHQPANPAVHKGGKMRMIRNIECIIPSFGKGIPTMLTQAKKIGNTQNKKADAMLHPRTGPERARAMEPTATLHHFMPEISCFPELRTIQ